VTLNSVPNRTRRLLTTSLAVLAGAGIIEPAYSLAEFALFDGLGHRGKPNLQRLGLRPLAWVGNIWRDGISHDTVDEEGVRLALKHLPRGIEAFYLDIEAWPVLHVSPAIRDESIRKLLRVADLVRGHMPSAKFGFYGLPPAITYWPLVDNRPSEYAGWIEANRHMEPLAERVDYIFPSLYTFYVDRPGWLTYANATIKAARHYGKPVYPFLWYQYHDSNSLLRDHEIADDAWNEELRFCHAHADGLVLWGGSGGWSESAAWWQSVRREFQIQR
jgi:hypothetical protein